MKQCYKCKIPKSLNDYSRDKSQKDNHNKYCKLCQVEQRLTASRKKLSVPTRIYSDQKYHSIARGHPLPSYTKKWFIDWCYSQPIFHTLYEDWVLSGYDTYKKPSANRINNSIHYTQTNIELMTWGENDSKGSDDIKNAILIKKDSFSIDVFDLNGNLLSTEPTGSHVCRKYKVTSSSVTRGIRGLKRQILPYIFKKHQ